MDKITALIADDVQEMRMLLRSILRAADCDVIGESPHGAHALESLKRQPADLLFLDLDMPGMSGLEVLAQLPALPQIPYTIIVSGDTREASLHSALALGAKNFIGKPYTAQKISEVLDAYTAQRPTLSALIADDDALMRDLLKNVLEKQSCKVVHAADHGQAALDYLAGHDEPDLVFLDIDMPVLDGISTLQKIRAAQKTVFCAMVSAHSTIDNVKNALSNGADGFIVKPYTEDKIKQILGKYQSKTSKT